MLSELYCSEYHLISIKAIAYKITNAEVDVALDFSEKLTQEIATSGRLPDVEKLVDRIKLPEHIFTILYGSSGVGKSSLVEAGLIPIIKGDSIDTRDILPVLRLY